MKGLALEGGGAKGSYEIGAFVALKKLGYKFDMVAGTSIGSLNAALIVQGDIELAKNLWMNANSEIVGISEYFVKTYKNFDITKENIEASINEIKKIIKNKGLDVSNYKELINKYIDEEKVRKSKINYGLVTVRLKDFKPLELTIKDIETGKLTDYIMASSYLPTFKMNKIIDDSFYLDGGFTNNLPISLLEKNGCNEVIAIRINGIGPTKKSNITKEKIIELAPTKDTGPILMFDNDDIKNNYYMGYYDTLLYFNKYHGFKYYFKKFYMYKYLARKTNNSLTNLIKLKYKTPDIKDTILKSIEEIMFDNKLEYYKVYSIPKTLRYIKKNKLKSKNSLVTEFVYQLKYFY